MTLRVLIADDEWLARERLRKWLMAEPDVQIVGECATGPEALAAIRSQAPDLVLLDVRMPDLDGFEVLRSLGDEPSPIVIFVTAHDRFALQAFEAQAMDYLLKPFDRERFRKAISRARALVQSNRSGDPVEKLRGAVEELAAARRPVERFAIRSGGRILVVKPEEIDWIRCADNYSELHVGEVVHLLRQTLGALEEQLQGSGFVRISRSLMVNGNRIREIRSKTHGDYLVVLLDGTELGASRNYRGALARLLGKSPG